MSKRKKEEILAVSNDFDEITRTEEALENKIKEAAMSLSAAGGESELRCEFTTEYLPEGREGSLDTRPEGISYFKVYSLSVFSSEFENIDVATENGKGFSFVILTFCENKKGSFTLSVNDTGLFDLLTDDIKRASAYIEEHGVNRFFYKIYHEEEKPASALVRFIMNSSKRRLAATAFSIMGVLIAAMILILIFG